MMLMPCQKKQKIQNQEEENVSVYNNAVTVVDDDLVVTQILSRLPAKSLMRCKCICKGWKSIIEHDSHFIDLHHTHSQARPVLLIATEEYRGLNMNWQTCFYSADLEYDSDGDNVVGANLRTLGRLNMRERVQELLGPIRGLVCLVDCFLAVQIYNVGTGQAITPWIKSEGAMTRITDPFGNWFGFDPRSGKHKVVHVWESLNHEAPICEVLTVGDNRWRIIDDAPPPCHVQGDTSVYANGSVYWIANSGKDLLVFDVGPEKFRMIPIPEFTCKMEHTRPYKELTEINGFPTVVCRDSNHATVYMWKFHDHNKQNGTAEEEDWSEVKVTLPSYIDVHYTYFHPIPGKDQMILETYSPSSGNNKFRRSVNLARFYSYNLTNNTVSKFEIQGISSVRNYCWTRWSTLVESL